MWKRLISHWQTSGSRVLTCRSRPWRLMRSRTTALTSDSCTDPWERPQTKKHTGRVQILAAALAPFLRIFLRMVFHFFSRSMSSVSTKSSCEHHCVVFLSSEGKTETSASKYSFAVFFLLVQGLEINFWFPEFMIFTCVYHCFNQNCISGEYHWDCESWEKDAYKGGEVAGDWDWRNDEKNGRAGLIFFSRFWRCGSFRIAIPKWFVPDLKGRRNEEQRERKSQKVWWHKLPRLD